MTLTNGEQALKIKEEIRQLEDSLTSFKPMSAKVQREKYAEDVNKRISFLSRRFVKLYDEASNKKNQ